MEPVSAIGSVLTLTRITLDLIDISAREAVRLIQLWSWYGPSALPLFIFGSRTTWRIQAQILGQLKDEDAMAFKDSVYGECTMIAVAAAIVAQIAITGLSLDSLNQTHWLARASFIISLTLALMAVYYATTQQRILGRLLQAKQVRLWIRGGRREFEKERIVPSLDQVLEHIAHRFFRRNVLPSNSILMATLSNPSELFRIRNDTLTVVFGRPFDNRPSDPDDYLPEIALPSAKLKASVLRQCFTPSVASVITISAPQGLLSGSLGALFIAVGVYFGFLWTKGLIENSGRNDSRNVFITYLVALGTSVLVYSISQLFQDDDKRSEGKILEDYLKEYVEEHPETVQRWGVTSQVVDGELLFTPIVPLQPTPL